MGLRSRGHPASLIDMSESLADLVERTLPAVVTLCGVTTAMEEVRGSGFAFDALGHIVTNHHVVEKVGTRVSAIAHGGVSLNAVVIGHDAVTDLAVVRLDSPISAVLGLSARRPRVGELCLAIGSPLGDFSESVSLGVVSGLDRSLPARDGKWSMEHMIQTDAAINHGNSGGPLLDMLGTVIGVNESGRTDGQNISFAVPAETTSQIVSELIKFGNVTRAALGVVAASTVKVVDGRSERRMMVRELRDTTSPLRPGDVLISIGGTPISDRGDLFRSLTRDLIGAPTSAEVIRDGAQITVQVVPTAAVSNA